VAAPLIVRLLMDAAGYLKTVDTAVGANTKLEQSSLGVGEAMQVSATKSVKASLQATEALKTQIVGYRELATSAEQSAAVRERAALLANKAEGRLNSQLGLTAAATVGTSKAVQTGERDLGKFTRGALAGSGAASSLGRSLAFASTGFIALAAGSTIIKSSVSAAIDLAKTQRQVEAQLQTSGKSWTQYGTQIDAVLLKESHLSGFTRQELLQGFGYLVRVNGNVSESLKLTAVAADVARGRNISLSAASIALAKALGGSETALKRLGITIPENVKGMDALNYVAAKFEGQAKAGATVGDRFHAVLVDTEETIGKALLPTFRRLTTELSNWLAKMNESGRLQRDVNTVEHDAGTIFHFLGGVIHNVDEVTGSFANTLKLLLEIQIARWAASAAVGLDGLAVKWGLVAGAASTAAKAETAALGVGGLTVAAGTAAAVSARTARNLPSVFGEYASTGEIAAVGGAAAVATSKVAALRAGLTSLAGRTFITTLVIQQVLSHKSQIESGVRSAAHDVGGHGGSAPSFTDFFTHPIRTFFYSPALHDAEVSAANKITDAINAQLVANLKRGNVAPSFFPNLPGSRASSTQTGPFGAARPIPVFKSFALTTSEQVAQAEAALTKSNADDVTAAKQIIARIKRLIDQGKLAGQSLVQGLQAEAAAFSVLQSAHQAAAQAAAQRAAAIKQAASTYTTPIDLQIAEVRSQLTKTNADDIRTEKAIIAAARAALASGSKNKQGQLAALQTIVQAQQAIQSLTSQTNTTFTLPLKLQLALARAQALGGDQTKILLKEKAALERALKASKGNIQKQIDIYNQIASINQQLGADANVAFGQYRQASLAAETAGLGLTRAQRKALEARLSQRGPGGTTPGSGVGAGGFIIGPDGRPIQVHAHRRPSHGQDTRGGDGAPRKLQATFNIRVYLDGRDVTRSVTIRQQKTRDSNPAQRRGPHAGRATA
jgi:hypothetical protein